MAWGVSQQTTRQKKLFYIDCEEEEPKEECYGEKLPMAWGVP